MDSAQILSNAQAISLKLSSRMSNNDTQHLFVLFCGLTKLGKTIMTEGGPETDLLPAPRISNDNERTFALTIKEIAPYISKLYYEKSNNDLKLYFALSENHLSKDQLVLEALFNPALTITIGDASEAGGRSDRQHTATMSGQEAIQALLPQFSQEEQDTLRLGGKMFASTEKLPGTSLYIGLVSQEDFAAANANPKLLTSVIRMLRECFGAQNSYLALYETGDQETVRGVLSSPSQDIRERVLQLLDAEGKEHWILFSVREPDLARARNTVINTLSPLWHKA